jgi:predicted TIM-barrel fold metal-dependent hydrolase
MSLQGKVDCHVHVVDPARFAYPEGPGNKPDVTEQGPREALQSVLSDHGVDHAVVVQLSGYGSDNRAMLDAIARSGGRYKGIAGIDPDTDEETLQRLEDCGVVGVRLNAVNLGRGVIANAERLLARVTARRWIVQIQCAAPDLPEFSALLKASKARLLFDHLGLPDVRRGVQEHGFQTLLSLAEVGATIKLSGAFRSSNVPFPHGDLEPFVAAICKAFPPQQRVWGSDWPFVACQPRPSYDETIEQLETWVPDPAERRIILSEAPRMLFGFAP